MGLLSGSELLERTEYVKHGLAPLVEEKGTIAHLSDYRVFAEISGYWTTETAIIQRSPKELSRVSLQYLDATLKVVLLQKQPDGHGSYTSPCGIGSLFLYVFLLNLLIDLIFGSNGIIGFISSHSTLCFNGEGAVPDYNRGDCQKIGTVGRVWIATTSCYIHISRVIYISYVVL